MQYRVGSVFKHPNGFHIILFSEHPDLSAYVVMYCVNDENGSVCFRDKPTIDMLIKFQLWVLVCE